MSVVLVIDGNSLLWRAFYAYGLYQNGVTTGTLKYIYKIINKFKPEDVVTCWDNGKSRWRRELYPAYKTNREERKEELDIRKIMEQARVAKSYLDCVGMRQVSVKNVEADDIISWLVDYYDRHCPTYDKIIVSTTDKDLWQLVNDKIVAYNPMKDTIVDKTYINNEVGVKPHRIADIKALMGDPSDGIMGVKGIGEKTAIKLVNEYGGIEGLLDLENIEKISKSKRTIKILEQCDVAESTLRLVKLSSLHDGKWFLTDEQVKELQWNLCKIPQVSQVDFHLVADRVGDTFPVKENMFSLSREDLTAMSVFFEKEEEERYPSLASLDDVISQCRRCVLRDDCVEFGPTLSEGFNDVEVMIVGRNPGYDELRYGKPFVGRAGKRLDQLLEEVGLTRRDCWITNVNKCYSKDNRPPSYGEMMACKGYLKSEIDLIKPKFIISLGNEAMSMLTPYSSTGVTKYCGEILEKPEGSILGRIDAWVAVCVHPSMALRSKAGELHMQFATEKIKEFLDRRRV